MKLAVLVLIGCGSAAPSVKPTSVVPVVAQQPVAAPHAHDIDALAVGGGAALTSDTAGAVRLWPTLDGTHEPMVVAVKGARTLALVPSATGFTAGILDGTRLSIIGLGRDGLVLSRAATTASQVVGAGGTLFVLRDHRAMAVDGAPIADRVIDLVVANRTAYVARGTTEVTAIAPIVDGKLGPEITLPEKLRPGVVLSPSGNRLVGLSAANEAVIIQLAPLSILARAPVPGAKAARFLDEDHLDAGHHLLSLTGTPNDPAMAQIPTALAFDGATRVFATGIGLAITEARVTHWLGWTQVQPDGVYPGAPGVLTFPFFTLAWLDDTLHATQLLTSEPWRPEGVTTAIRPHPLEGRWVVCSAGYGPEGIDWMKYAICDVTTGTATTFSVELGSPNIVYEPSTRTLAVFGDVLMRRWRFDPATGAVTPLPDLPGGGEAVLFDPAIASGIEVITKRQRRVTTHRTGSAPVETTLPADSELIGADRRGTIFVVAPPIHPFNDKESIPAQRVIAVPGGSGFPIAPSRVAAASPDGRIATAAKSLVVYDRTGSTLWKDPASGITSMAFSRDGATLIAVTKLGVIAFEAATGRRKGTACGWGFGLHAALDSQVATGGSTQCPP